MSDVARLESGHTPSRRRPDWWSGDIPWLALPDIRALDGQTVNDTSEFTNELGLGNSSARLLPEGTVALSRTASVGFVAVFGKPMATSQDFFNWVCGDDLESWFLAHALIASRDYLRSLSSGAVHKTIYMPVAEELMVCMPNQAEQRRIAAALDAQMVSIANARGLRLAAADEAEALNICYQQSVFGNMGDCRRRSIGDLSEVRGGIQKSPHRRPIMNPVRYLTVAHIQRDRILTDDPRFFEVRADELECWRLKPGDVLIIEGNGSAEQIGRTALFRGEIQDCVHQNHVIRVRPDRDQVEPKFLNAFLNSPPGQAEVQARSQTSSGLRTLSSGSIRSIEVPLPPLDTQRRIVADLRALLGKVDGIKQLQTRAAAELSLLRPAVLRAAFSGAL